MKIHQAILFIIFESDQLDGIFNHWAKVRINDDEVKKLIQLALAPNKEAIQNLNAGNQEYLSAYFENMCNSAFEYAMVNDSQQLETTKGTLFGAYNAVTGYFQNVKTYKDSESKLKSLLYGGVGQMRAQKAFNLCMKFEECGVNGLN